jgi:two-component system sensor histidine kinase QseC
MKSIRLFLITVLFSTIAVVIFIAMLVGYRGSLRQAENLFEKELEKKYLLIDQLLIYFDGQKTLVADRRNPLAAHHNFLYQVLNRDGKIILQSPELGKNILTPLENGSSDFNFDGKRWHARTHEATQLPLWIMVAEEDALRYRLADAIIVDILKPILIGLSLIVVLIWTVIHSGFKPVKRLSQAIYQKSASDLSAIHIDQTPDELKLISQSVNDLFKRITESFEREKRFTADAAHEMRNPITALKIHIDNLLEETPEKSDSLLKIKQAIDRLSNLVEQLLILHRMSPEQYAASFVQVDLYEIAQDVIQDLYPRIDKKQQTVELYGEPCLMKADPFGMEILLKNLIDNANKYTPEQGRISITLKNHPDICLTVEDSGEGIPADEQIRVMDRFYRVGGDRHSSKVIGSGLGMSIVKHIAELHHATIQLGTSSLGGLMIEIHFPETRRASA